MFIRKMAAVTICAAHLTPLRGLCNCSWCFWEVGGGREGEVSGGRGGGQGAEVRSVAAPSWDELPRSPQRLLGVLLGLSAFFSSACVDWAAAQQKQTGAAPAGARLWKRACDKRAACGVSNAARRLLWWCLLLFRRLRKKPLTSCAGFVNFRAQRLNPGGWVSHSLAHSIWSTSVKRWGEGVREVGEMLLFGGHRHGNSWINERFGGGVKWITLHYSPDMEVDENEHGRSCRDGKDGADELIRDRQR